MENLNCFILTDHFCKQISLPAKNGTICPGPSTPEGPRCFRPRKAVPCALKKASLTAEASVAVPLFLMALVCLISIMNIYGLAVRKIVELRNVSEASAMLPGSEGRITLSVPVTFTPFYLPEGVFSRTILCTASVHSWNGRSEEEDNEGAASSSEFVYVTDNESVYHTSAECTHLDLSIHAASGSAVQSMKNADGAHYHACDKCVSEGHPDALVYVTEHGDCYHNSAGCSGLKRSVRLVDASTLGDLHICQRCAAAS